jgi:hypothetical protein
VNRNIPVQKCSVSIDIPVQNIQLKGIFQYKIFSQQEYSSTKYSVRKHIIPVQTNQSVGNNAVS